MGDRTCGQVTIYACPPDQVNAVLDVLDQYGLYEGDWEGTYPREPLTSLTLGEMYGDNQMSCGAADDIAAVLTDVAPGAAFEVSEDPYADWLGSLNRYTPSLGHWSAECDANGQPQFSGDVILSWLDAHLSRAEIEDRLGIPWRRALDALLPEDSAENRITLPRLVEGDA